MRLDITEDGRRYIALIRLPFGLGVTLGCSSWVSIRSWQWARYDFADHEPRNARLWAEIVLSEPMGELSPMGAWIERRKVWR